MLDQGFVVLFGPNGAGKTNFLEGIYFGLTLSRFPTSHLSQLMLEREQFFRVAIELRNADDERFEVFGTREDERTALKFRINNQTMNRASYAGRAAAVSFIPEDLNLLTHSPAGRRRFLDEVLGSAGAQIKHAIMRYDRALRQRNQALQSIAQSGVNDSHLEVWDEQLADYGSQITRARADFIEAVNTSVGQVLKTFSPDIESIKFEYRFSGAPIKEDFLRKLRESKARERETLTTAVGPHRDDFLTIGGSGNAVGYLSRGQLRSVTLALKIMEKNYMEKFGRHPIMLLDDVFSEFDGVHQRQLAEFLRGFEQVFLTTAQPSDIKDHLPSSAQLYNVKAGVIAKPQ